MSTRMNCTALAVRTDFDNYARKLLNSTENDLERLSQCKLEVCGAIWGQGNSDISGIGVRYNTLVMVDAGLTLCHRC